MPPSACVWLWIGHPVSGFNTRCYSVALWSHQAHPVLLQLNFVYFVFIFSSKIQNRSDTSSTTASCCHPNIHARRNWPFRLVGIGKNSKSKKFNRKFIHASSVAEYPSSGSSEIVSHHKWNTRNWRRSPKNSGSQRGISQRVKYLHLFSKIKIRVLINGIQRSLLAPFPDRKDFFLLIILFLWKKLVRKIAEKYTENWKKFN